MLALETKQSGGKLPPSPHPYGHVAHMREKREVYRVLVGKPEGKRPLGIDGWIILGWISRRWDVGIWTGLGRPRIGTGG